MSEGNIFNKSLTAQFPGYKTVISSRMIVDTLDIIP